MSTEPIEALIARVNERYKNTADNLFGDLDVSEMLYTIERLAASRLSVPREGEDIPEPDEFTTMNLVMFVRRLAQQLCKFDPENTAAKQATNWLERNGVTGSALRAPSAKTPA